MKVLLVNGSPHEHGCTDRALQEVAGALEAEGVRTETFWIGARPVGGCTACGACGETGRCAFEGGGVNEFAAKAADADGFVFGAPTHYAHAGASLLGFMDRLFYSAGAAFAHKPAAAVTSARRAGTTTALADIEKFFTISQMPIVSSRYWNMVHGNTPEEVRQDAEGMQTMRNLARNLLWMIQCIQAGKAAGIQPPQAERSARTNFIR